ncbi:lachesin [Acyrthosiphon pisum]|uniref:Ig-like domain-containing protein n=1 Tax=Acyrthosiphon pisum TaxID=7029 RepID=A0A8R2D2A5_ACYPI|nr:lachesin [Acyrthosiphon pisum]XP_016656425.1 lachesin [Acyrthosiphon pisum]XP_016656427.1 lachesin [Acyrthosiphon pisum]|eukprot:XP_003241581.1 PREDICTED: lachesin [Acyrthosiphon pisum]
MKNVYGVLVVLCIHLAYSERTPMISHITQKRITDIGDTTELTCTVLYGSDFNILWIKVDKERSTEPVTFSSGSTLIIRDSRLSLRYDMGSNSYSLQISDIQETDAGFYRCDVSLGINNKLSAETELVVRRPPFISDNSTRSLVVNEGQPVTLECYAGGYPSPKISWRRANNAILANNISIYRGNVLKMSSIKKEDRGTYFCIAENGVGRGARRNIALEVEFAPVITIPKRRLGQALQYDMDLECHVEAYPPPAIIWLNNGVQLSNNQHYGISHFATTDEITDTTIRIITIENRQYGDYVCKASNVLGTTEVTVTLYETIIPVCPPACGQLSSAHLKNSTVKMSSANVSLLIAIYLLLFT